MTNQNLERSEEKRAPNPAECMAKICLERRRFALFTVTEKYPKYKKYKAARPLHYIIQR